MQEQNEVVTKKGNKSVKRLIIVAVVVLIATIGIVCWQAGQKGMLFTDEENNTQEKVDNNDVNKEPEEPVQEESGITEDLIKEIYEKKLPVINDYAFQTSVYTTEKVTVENANLKYLRAFAFNNIEFKERDLLPFINEDGSEMCDEYTPCDFKSLLSEGWYRFDAKLLQEQAKKLYGREIENGEFYESIASGAQYLDGYYVHSQGGGTNAYAGSYRNYVSYEIIDDILYITDEYLYVRGEYKLDENANEIVIVIVYTDSELKNALGTEKYVEKSNEKDSIRNQVINDYGSKALKYKHAFKQNTDGTWYWISTEPVK